jgi:hypothetical protein
MNDKRPTSILSSLSCPIRSGTNRVIFEDQGPHATLLPKLIFRELRIDNDDHFVECK